MHMGGGGGGVCVCVGGGGGGQQYLSMHPGKAFKRSNEAAR